MMRKATSRLLLIGCLSATGCAGMPPALTDAVVALGRDFIGQTAANYAPDYAQSVNQLLLTVAEISTGAPFASGGGGSYQAHTVYDDPNPIYQEPYADQPDLGMQEAAHSDPMMSGSFDPDPMMNPPSDAYPDPMQGGSYDDQQADVGTQSSYGYSAEQQVPPQGSRPSDAPVNQPLELTADLLAQSFAPDGRVLLRPVQDGDVLTDGRGDPVAGDKLKLRFQSNCSCFLYIISVDATGWVTPVFPEAGQMAQPIAAGRAQQIPQGDEWWGLDDYRGVEQIYFILSRVRRPDLEAQLAALPTDRPAPGSDYAAVQEPTLLATRGLVKVKDAAPVGAAQPAGVSQLTHASFTTQMLTGDLVVTRWFQHH